MFPPHTEFLTPTCALSCLLLRVQHCLCNVRLTKKYKQTILLQLPKVPPWHPDGMLSCYTLQSQAISLSGCNVSITSGQPFLYTPRYTDSPKACRCEPLNRQHGYFIQEAATACTKCNPPPPPPPLPGHPTRKTSCCLIQTRGGKGVSP